MNRARTLTWLLMGVVAGLAAGMVSSAGAQYPPPNGTVEVAAEQETAVLGASIGISATVQDQNGVAAAGVECTFAISDQPGSDASVDAGPVTTDAEGVARTTLTVGSTAGTIVVEASCGELSAQVSVVAGAEAAPAATATPAEQAAAPPASLPSSGAGSGGGADAASLAALIASGVALVMAAAALSWRRTRKSQ